MYFLCVAKIFHWQGRHLPRYRPLGQTGERAGSAANLLNGKLEMIKMWNNMIGRSKGRSCTPSRCSRRHFEFLYIQHKHLSFWQPRQTIWRFELIWRRPRPPSSSWLLSSLSPRWGRSTSLTFNPKLWLCRRGWRSRGTTGRTSSTPRCSLPPSSIWPTIKRLFVFGRLVWD